MDFNTNVPTPLTNAFLYPSSHPALPPTLAVDPTGGAASAQASKTTQKSSVKTSGAGNIAPMPGIPTVPFATGSYNYVPTVMPEALQNIGEPPVQNQNLAQYLGGQPLAQHVQPPTFQQFGAPPTLQGFAQPVFSGMDTFAMTPDMYNSVLDTTKNNIAFNNNVAQQNWQMQNTQAQLNNALQQDTFTNRLNAVKNVQEADKTQQEHWKDLVVARNSWLSGAQSEKQTAYMEDPVTQATRQYQMQTGLAQFEGKIREHLEGVKHKYDLMLMNAKSAQDAQNLVKAYRLDALKTFNEMGKSVITKALEGMTSEDLQAYNDALSKGDSSAALNILNAIQVKDPVSQATIQAARNMLPMFEASTGLPVGALLGSALPTVNASKPKDTGKVFNSIDDYLATKKK